MTKRIRKLWAIGFGKLGRNYCKHKWFEDVFQLIPYGASAIDDILRKSACRYELMEHLTNGEDSLDLLSGIDQRIMSTVRSMHHPLTYSDREICYRDVLAGASLRESFDLETALALLNTNSVVPQYGEPAIDVRFVFQTMTPVWKQLHYTSFACIFLILNILFNFSFVKQSGEDFSSAVIGRANAPFTPC